MNVGKAVKLYRISKDISLEDLAKQADISKSYLHKIESGERNPSSEVIHALADALDISAIDLMSNRITLGL